MLWDGSLKDSDLVWQCAFPDQSLDLAADTEAPVGKYTVEKQLLDGEVRFRVVPGIETGRIEIQLEPFGDREAEG